MYFVQDLSEIKENSNFRKIFNVLNGKQPGCISAISNAVDLDNSQKETEVPIVDEHRRTSF